MTLPLDDVRPVHAGGRNLDHDFAGAAPGTRTLDWNKHLRPARRADLDRDHLIIVVDAG